jgi:hypothetical protein
MTRTCETHRWCVETDREHNTDDDDHYGEVATARAGESSVRVWADRRADGWVILLDEFEWRIEAPNTSDLRQRISEEIRDIRSIVDQIDDALTTWLASLPA